MNNANRFAPPGAEVDDVASAATQAVRLWPPRGRIGRLRLLAYSSGAWILATLASGLFGLVIGMSRGSIGVVQAVGWVCAAAYIVVSALLLIQRSHDMGWSGWWSLAAMVPFVGLLWIFKRGDAEANRFGAPPPPNTIVVRILGLLLPLVFVIGILAAVALPAYQGYVTKARAAQGR